MLDATPIKEFAYTLGFDIARVTTAEAFPEAERAIKERVERGWFDGLSWFNAERAEVSCHPDALLPEAKSIIALAMCYMTEQPEDGEAGEVRGRIARYAWGDDYHDIIKPKLQQFALWLQEYARKNMGAEAETRLFVDTGRMVDRAVAERAGLGWFGKNTNILTKSRGSWVFLAEIVTNLPIRIDEPLKANCGGCDICLRACPTGALPTAYELHSDRCISYLTIELRGSIPLDLRPLMGNLIFGCDICQEVCPVNKVVEKRLGLCDTTGKQMIRSESISRRVPGSEETQGRFTPHAVFQKRPKVGSTPELVELLALTDEQFRERFRGSPIKRTKRRGLLRNVCVALGNIRDPQTVPALVRALDDDEPLIRGHAAWALGRIANEEAIQALRQRMTLEDDGEVQQELYNAIKMVKSVPV